MPYDVQLVAGNGAGCGKISRSRRFFTREGGKNIFFARFVALQFFFEGSYGQLNEWRTKFVNEKIVAKITNLVLKIKLKITNFLISLKKEGSQSGNVGSYLDTVLYHSVVGCFNLLQLQKAVLVV